LKNRPLDPRKTFDYVAIFLSQQCCHTPRDFHEPSNRWFTAYPRLPFPNYRHFPRNHHCFARVSHFPVCVSDFLVGVSHFLVCVSDFLVGVGHFLVCVGDFLVGVSHFLVCVSDFLVGVGHFLVCVGDFLVGVSHFLVCVSDFLVGVGHFLVCVGDFLVGVGHFLVCVGDFLVCVDGIRRRPETMKKNFRAMISRHIGSIFIILDKIEQPPRKYP
jgi:hypothetical protein